MAAVLNFRIFVKNGKTQICFYFTNETGSCETTVQLLQNVHGVDITHYNVCSSMLSCFFSYVAATIKGVLPNFFQLFFIH